MSDEKKISDFLAYIVSAVSNCSMYSPEHSAVSEFSKKILNLTADLFSEDSFSITLLSGSLIFNGVPVSKTGAHISRFTKKIRLNGIERIIVEKGVTMEEIKAFVTSLASKEMNVSSSPHISVGMLEIRYKAEGDFSSIMDESIAKVNEVYDGVSRFQRLDVRGIEDIIGGFITALKREANVLSSLSPVKSHSTYTYVHETNVAVLTIFQAEALGLTGEALHDAGQAGLLHDVGKLFVPKEIIEKDKELDDKEWEIIKLHPVYGALYLGTLPDVSKVAAIAAYEHHIKYDLSGYPRAGIRTREQHLISQIVAIADVFDALRTKRTYRTSFEVPAIINILRKGAGKDFNPLLLDNFLEACKRVKAL